MIDMAKMYFYLREAHCISTPEIEDLEEFDLLIEYKHYADSICEEIRALTKLA